MNNEVEKILSDIQNEDPKFVRKALKRALYELKSEQEQRRQDAQSEMQTMTLDEVNEELQRVGPFGPTKEQMRYRQLMKIRAQRLEEQRVEAAKPTEEQIKQRDSKRAELQKQIEGIDEQIIELTPKLSIDPNGFHKLKKLNYTKRELKRDLQSFEQ